MLVSPLLRTRQTTDAILALQPSVPTIEIVPFLREIDHGPDENRTEPEIIDRIGPEALAAWDSSAVAPQGWTVDAPTRLVAWRNLLTALVPQQRPILLVTSNGAARFALLADPALRSPTLKLATGSYGVIRREANGSVTVQVWGFRP